MNGESLRRTVIVRNSQGLHMRPATGLAELAGKFQSEVFLQRPGQEKVSGKSPFGIITMAAEMGTELVIEATGPDAEQVLDALAKFFDELVISEP